MVFEKNETKINEVSSLKNNRSKNFIMDTRSIVADYIKYRLQNSGYTWDNDGRPANVSPNSVQIAMRTLGDEFEERFSSRFDDLIDQLNINDENAYETYTAIVNEIFSDSINWGRIVALFGFSGRFAVRCYELNKTHLVDNLLEWLTTYVDTRLSSWMNSHNNWQGFMEFQSGSGEHKIDSPWPSFKTLLSCAAAVGALTIGAILSQKS